MPRRRVLRGSPARRTPGRSARTTSSPTASGRAHCSPSCWELTADDIALVPAASYGVAIAAANLPFGRGRRILMLAEQFPSNVYAWRELAQARGRRGRDPATTARWRLERCDPRPARRAGRDHRPAALPLDRRRPDRPRERRGALSRGRQRARDRRDAVAGRPAARPRHDPARFSGLRRLQVAARALQPRLSLRRAPLAGWAAARAQLDRAHRQREFRRAGRLSGRLSARRAPLRRRRAGQLRPDARRHRRARAAAALGPAGDHRDPGGAHCGHRCARECLGPARAAGAAAGRAFFGAAASRRARRPACRRGWQRSVSMSACAAIRCA